MKRITPNQHAQAVLRSHMAYDTRGYREYATFAEPGETQAEAIKRYMAKLKRDKRKPDARQFPKKAENLANTRVYVEEYYRLNRLTASPVGDYVTSLFGELSTNPTVWPETDEVLVEFVD